MVIAGVLMENKDINKLKSIGVKDSKLLTKEQRNILFYEIEKTVKDYKIIKVMPREIDEALFSEESNLNKLESIKSAIIINALNPKKVILDCPSKNIPQYINYVKLFVKDKSIQITGYHEADLKYPIVAAASIIAKITRDNEIENIQRGIEENIGSGYSHDPLTQKFLKDNYNKYPDIFRKSWISYKNIAEKKKQRRLVEF